MEDIKEGLAKKAKEATEAAEVKAKEEVASKAKEAKETIEKKLK